jgi:hypothetical protein
VFFAQFFRLLFMTLQYAFLSFVLHQSIFNVTDRNDGSDTEDRSVRRTHQTPSDSERLPTFSTSYRHVIGRPVWRAASVDGLFSTLPDNNSNKTPPSTCTQQLKKDSSYLTSVKDDANEEVTEKDVGDSQPAAPGSNTTADASDRGTSSSPPQQLPPPSSRKTVDEKPVAEHSVPVMQASVIVAEAVTTRTTVDGGDVFEDVGDAAAAFFGEGAAPSTTVFRKPRPPSARSRGSRSPSPSPVAIKMTTLMTVSTEQSVFDTTSGPTLVQLSVGTQQETDSTGREQRCNEPANCSVASPSADEFIISSRDGSRSVSRSPWLSTTEIAPLIDLADSRSVSSPTGVEQQYASSCSDRLSHNNEDDNSGMLTPDSGIADIVAVSAVNHSAMSCSESPVNLVDETCSTDSWHNGELIDISVKAQNTDKRFDESNRQKLTTNNENSFIDRRTTAAVDERRYTRENANVENTNSLAFDELTTNVIAGREDEERQVKELVNGVTTLSSGKSFSTCDAATNDGRDAAKHSALVHLDLGNDLATTDDESSKRIAELPIDLHVGNIGDHSRKLADNDKLANGSCLSTLNRVEMFDEDHQEPTVALTNGDSEHRKSNVAERNVTYDKKPAEEIGEKCKVIDLVLVKDCVGIGFCIEGGSFVDRHSPIKVKRMFKGMFHLFLPHLCH